MTIINYIKTKTVVIILCFGLLFSYSCGEDFINLIPEEAIDKGSFFKNETELLLALNGTYRMQTNFYAGLLSYQIREGRSDDTVIDQQEPKSDRAQLADHITDYLMSQLVAGLKSDMEVMVPRANLLPQR